MIRKDEKNNTFYSVDIGTE